MPPRPSIDERLRQFREIRDQGDRDAIRRAVEKNLTDSCNLIVAEAAKLIGDSELSGFETPLVTTWNRLINHTDPIKADKGCAAKSTIIAALGQLKYDEPEFYLAAISYQQIEPAWPRAEDTAENVRANAAFALAASQRLRTIDKLNAFVDYLQGTRCDRINAVRAIADTGHEAAIPLLRCKLLSGDSEAEVMGACMTGLLALTTDAAIPLVARFLRSSDESLIVEAATALGGCSRPQAVEALISSCHRIVDEELRRSLLLSIGLSRLPVAIDYLIAQLSLDSNADAALDALKPACVYEETRRRVVETLKKTNNRPLLALFRQRFGED